MTVVDDILAAPDLDAALAQIIAHFKADSGTIHLLERDGLLHLKAAANIPPAVQRIVRTVPVGKGMAGLAVERKSPVDACNIQTDSTGDVRPGAKATGLAGAIVVPIIRGDKAIGALGIATYAERIFTDAEKSLLLDCGRAIAEKTNWWTMPQRFIRWLIAPAYFGWRGKLVMIAFAIMIGAMCLLKVPWERTEIGPWGRSEFVDLRWIWEGPGSLTSPNISIQHRVDYATWAGRAFVGIGQFAVVWIVARDIARNMRVHKGLCRWCGYDRRGLGDARCPECGSISNT